MMSLSIEEYRERLRAGTTRPLPDYPEGSRDHRCVVNDPLVRATVARRFGREDHDLLQAGRLGMLRAAEGFNAAKGRFSTYATWWIVNRAFHEIRESQLIHTPRPQKRSHDSANARAARALEAATRWSIDDDLIQVPDESAEERAEAERVEGVRDAVRLSLLRLDSRRREVVERRFGLDGDEPESLAAVGKRLGVTKERVRQLEWQAIQILARHLADYSEAS